MNSIVMQVLQQTMPGFMNLSTAVILSVFEGRLRWLKTFPETIEKIVANFESYWNSKKFKYYNETLKEHLVRALN